MSATWEYKVEEKNANVLSSKKTVRQHEQYLAEMDAQGWELISTVASEAVGVSYATRFYFRRPATNA